MGASEVGLDSCALQPLDRLAVKRFGAAAVAEQRTRSRHRTEGPVGRGSDGPSLELLQRVGGIGNRASADAGLDTLDEAAPMEAEVVELARTLGRSEGVVVAAET